MTSQNAKTELINWRRQLEKLNQPIDAEAWDYAIAAIDALDKIKACDAISRHDAIKEIMGQPTELHYPDWYAWQINNMPAVQPERKRGNWKQIAVYEMKDGAGFVGEALCPICNTYSSQLSSLGYVCYDICPRCGADMGGNSDDQRRNDATGFRLDE